MTRVLGSVGCALLLVMLLTHVAERWHLFPSMVIWLSGTQSSFIAKNAALSKKPTAR